MFTMPYNNVILTLLVICWLCSMGDSASIASKIPIQSHIIGGYKNSLTKKNDISKLDCSQFNNDYDVLQQFPFPVLLNPIRHLYNQSTATMDENNIFVKKIYIHEEEVVPLSVFCLSKLDKLSIVMTPFENDIVPDALLNLKLLSAFWIYDSSILKIPEQLGTLNKLGTLIFDNCSLTHFPNLSKLENLWIIEVRNNPLSVIDGFPDVMLMDLRNNLFDEIPIVKKREALETIAMDNNPLKNIESITSYINLEHLYLSNTTLKFIPSSIGKLQKLTHLDLSHNQLSHIPKSILDLPRLEYLNIENTLLSTEDIQSIEKAFRTFHPNATLII
ncbi:unnamed protein product [Rotaria sordida]|uniref:Chaoptin n=1 Tax=Rotaria sordida TaxID=392033 RepID=A0A820D2U2_9BILA|nr:unnamed protein product [Rotaria sordida]CAF4228056.1 unnamed protein product [Rotaria sordida]